MVGGPCGWWATVVGGPLWLVCCYGWCAAVVGVLLWLVCCCGWLLWSCICFLCLQGDAEIRVSRTCVHVGYSRMENKTNDLPNDITEKPIVNNDSYKTAPFKANV